MLLAFETYIGLVFGTGQATPLAYYGASYIHVLRIYITLQIKKGTYYYVTFSYNVT